MKTIGVVGTGVIGAGWAVRALSRGYDVVAWDPAPDAEERLRASVARAWPSATKLGLFPGADPARLRFAQNAEALAGDVDYIQENAPENEALKRSLLQTLATNSEPHTIIASSSSGLMPSALQDGCVNPERVLIGHPFNPVYLLPLVEIVAGAQTSVDSIERAKAHYDDLVMQTLVVRNEIEGYLSDRLQEALWREVLHLVNDGIATTEELDDAIAYGPGIRWAGMGTNLTFHLAGGDEGMRHMLRQFGPALKLPWTKLVAPELTEGLIEAMADGCLEQADGRSIAELEQLRDDYVLSVMHSLVPHDIASGKIVTRRANRIAAEHAKVAVAAAEARTSPFAPDFYEHDWNSLAGAVVARDGAVEVNWADGLSLRCHPAWLRENSPGHGGVHPLSRENELDPRLLPVDLSVSTVEVDSTGALRVVFHPENRVSTIHPGWLRHVAEQRHHPFSVIPEPRLWTAADIAEPPTHDGQEVLHDDSALLAWLTDLVSYGVARLRGLPDDPSFLGHFGPRLGALRDSNFGLVWHVDVDLDPASTANTPLALPAHADLPTRETPPGYQFLHCLINSASGGLSTMTDGLAVAREIEATDPDAFAALRELRWVFFNRAKDGDHRWTGPMIDHGDGRVPFTFRAFHPVRAFPDMAYADIDRAYASIRTFGEVANSDSLQMRYEFKAGDLVVFDNRRILHGRTAFEAGPQSRRRLHGTYMDSDEIYSRFRVLTHRGG